MKSGLKTTIPLFLLLLTSACSNGADKFTGRWAMLLGNEKPPIVVIERKGDKYTMYQDGKPETATTSFVYDKEHDLLTAQESGATIDIRYDEATKHLKMATRSGGEYMTPAELERVK